MKVLEDQLVFQDLEDCEENQDLLETLGHQVFQGIQGEMAYLDLKVQQERMAKYS